MWNWLIFVVLCGFAVCNTVFSALLFRGKLRGLEHFVNPKREDGSYLYETEKLYRTYCWSIAIQAVSQLLAALVVLLAMTLHIVSGTVLMVTFYLMGALLTAAFVGQAYYADMYCKTEEAPPQELTEDDDT